MVDATFESRSCLPACEDELHPYERERRDGFPGPTRKLSCRSVRFVTDIGVAALSGVLRGGMSFRVGLFPVPGSATVPRPAPCYTVPGWLVNVSANISSLISIGANKSRGRFRSPRNRWRRHQQRGTKTIAGLKSEQVMVR